MTAIQEVMGQLRHLPSPPKLYFQVVMELQSPNASLKKIGGLVAQDMAMSAKLLQLVNSAVFGLHRQVSDPVEAVLHMGLEMTKSLILLGHTFAYFDQFKRSEFCIDELWRHSFATGQLAQTLASLENAGPELTSQSFTAGMMHDLGKLALAANLPDQFNAALKLAREQKLQLWEAESEVIGASHAEVGACLLCIWGLPMPIVEAVALHHYPVQLTSNEFCPLAAVHVANVFEHEAQPQPQAGACPSVDAAYLEEMGFSNLIETWRSLCLEKRPTAAA